MRTLAALLLLAPGVALAAPPHDELFASSTEDSTAGWARIPEALARALVASGDASDRTLVDDTIRGKGLARNDAQFFRAKAVRLAVAGLPMRFVRPPDKPYYLPFYGAHIFRFWFVDARGQIVFASAADAVAVLKSSHAGLHDLRVSQCHGGGCDDTVEVFAHGRYEAAACTTTTDAGTAVVACR